MKRIYSQNVKVGESGGIGTPAEMPNSTAFMINRVNNGRMGSANNKRTYDYMTRQNQNTKFGKDFPIQSRSSLNQFQNRNKGLLQYKSQFDKMRGFQQQFASAQTGFKGFGRPQADLNETDESNMTIKKAASS